MAATDSADGLEVARGGVAEHSDRRGSGPPVCTWRCAALVVAAVAAAALVTAATFSPSPREALPFSSTLGPETSLRDAVGSQHRRWDDVIAEHPFVRPGGNVTAVPVYAPLGHGTVGAVDGATVLTRADFFRLHVATSTPALVKGAWSDSAAVQQWADSDSVVGAIGHMPVSVQLVERGAFDLHSTWREETMP